MMKKVATAIFDGGARPPPCSDSDVNSFIGFREDRTTPGWGWTEARVSRASEALQREMGKQMGAAVLWGRCRSTGFGWEATGARLRPRGLGRRVTQIGGLRARYYMSWKF